MAGTGGWARACAWSRSWRRLEVCRPTGRNPVLNQAGRRMCRYTKRDQRQVDPRRVALHVAERPMPDEVIWLTYDGLAERLGIEKESARQRARRGMWARRKDNLGRITVAVPADLLESQTDALRDTPTEAIQDPLPDALHEAVENRYLNRYVEKIEQALE